MFGKLKVFFELFQKGKEVADPAKWKNRQVTVTALVGVLLALVHVAKEFGYVLPIDENVATSIAGGVIAIVNILLTYTTSAKVGIPTEEKTNFPELLPVANVKQEIVERIEDNEQLRGS